MTARETIGAARRRAGQSIDRLDARLLLEHVCGIRHADLIAHPERELTEAQAARFDALLDRRVTIPMMGGVDSLNVTAAAAVAFYATR